jgi:hypothetical protein
MNFSTSPPKAWTAPPMQSNQPPSAAMTAGGRLGLGQRGEAAQVGIEQHRPNGLADFAPQRPRQHARGAAPAEIGFQCGRQRRPRRERGERRCGEAGGLAQSICFRFP